MPTFDPIRFQEEFFFRCSNLREPIEMMAQMPNVNLFVKDTDSRYVFNNEAHRVRYDRISPRDLIGKRASDFFPPLLGEAYEANDRTLFEKGSSLSNEIWLVPTIRGTPGWFVSSKSPLRSASGEIVGLLGLMYPIETPEDQQAYFGKLQVPISYIDSHFIDEITVQHLADLAGLSVAQFNRLFRRILRLSPMEYVLSRRIQEAQRLLSTTNRSMGEIAASIGFYDQSHFTKRFRKVTGVTPLNYRRHFR